MTTRYGIIRWSDEMTGINSVTQAGAGTFATLAEAEENLSGAGDYIVAVDDGFARPLTRSEVEKHACTIAENQR